MAYSDYLHCANCDCKTIYDAEINYDVANCADILTLCKDCAYKLKYRLVMVNRDGDEVKVKGQRGSDFLEDGYSEDYQEYIESIRCGTDV